MSENSNYHIATLIILIIIAICVYVVMKILMGC